MESLWNHIEWVFSGIGVAILVWIFSKLKNKSQDNSIDFTEKGVNLKNENIENHAELVKEIKNETEGKKISDRFKHIHNLMNQGRNHEEFTIPKMAQLMSLEKVSDLEDIILFKKEPTFNFVAHFCSTFGVNKEWVLEGKKYPFYSDEQTKPYAAWYYQDIESIEPERIYFVRCDSETAEAFIILKLSEWKYKTFHRIWHISSKVGGTGSRQILSFYELIKKLKGKYYTQCGGRTLKKELFDSLYLGKIFPGQVFWAIGGAEDPWWDDFTDVYHKYPIAKEYKRMHGQSFIDAQNIVKWQLKEEISN